MGEALTGKARGKRRVERATRGERSILGGFRGDVKDGLGGIED
jgi:hypothetical protein